MESIKNLHAFVEQHETVVAFLVPILALLATFFLIALVCRQQQGGPQNAAPGFSFGTPQLRASLRGSQG